MKTNIDFNKNEDAMKLALSQVKQKKIKIEAGGGKKAIEKQGQVESKKVVSLLLN